MNTGFRCLRCIFPRLSGGCPITGHCNNGACITLFKDRNTCKKEDCPTCRYLKYCKEKGINLNKGE